MKTTQSFKAEFKVSKLALFPLIVKKKSKFDVLPEDMPAMEQVIFPVTVSVSAVDPSYKLRIAKALTKNFDFILRYVSICHHPYVQDSHLS